MKYDLVAFLCCISLFIKITQQKLKLFSSSKRQRGHYPSKFKVLLDKVAGARWFFGRYEFFLVFARNCFFLIDDSFRSFLTKKWLKTTKLVHVIFWRISKLFSRLIDFLQKSKRKLVKMMRVQ